MWTDHATRSIGCLTFLAGVPSIDWGRDEHQVGQVELCHFILLQLLVFGNVYRCTNPSESMAPFHATFAQFQWRKARLCPSAPAAIIASRWQIIKPAAVLAATTPSVVVMRCNRHVLWSPHISQQFLRSANNEQRTEQIACERGGENWPRWQIAE